MVVTTRYYTGTPLILYGINSSRDGGGDRIGDRYSIVDGGIR